MKNSWQPTLVNPNQMELCSMFELLLPILISIIVFLSFQDIVQIFNLNWKHITVVTCLTFNCHFWE